jgi:predicted N-acetyltransferase YhbS
LTNSTPTAFNIRAARPDDFEDVRATARVTLPQTTDDETASAFASNVANWMPAKRSIHVAEVGERIVGHVSIGPYQDGEGPIFQSRSMILQQLAVLPSFQGNGIGEALLAKGIETARWFEAGIVFAAVNEDSAPFYSHHGWKVGEANVGLTFIEQESVHDAGGRTEDDVVGLLAKATVPRGGKVSLPGGFNRMAHVVIDPAIIRVVFATPVTATNPQGRPLLATVDWICENPSAISVLPLSVLLAVTGDLTRRLGGKETRNLVRRWLRESGEGKEVPARLGAPTMTSMQIFDSLFSNM